MQMQGRPGRWLYAVMAVSLVLGGVGAWWWGRPQHSCAVSEQVLAGVWDEPRREALRQAFLATRQPYAESTWRLVEQLLGRYLQGWREARQQACEATRVWGEQPEQVLELRLSCLERRLKEVAAVVAVLASVQGQELAQSSRAPEQLTPLAVCMDMTELAAREQRPEDPSVRARVEELQERLTQLNALFTAGRHTQALEQATALAEAAEATGFQPLMAESWLLLARLQYASTKDTEVIIQNTHRAARAFLASGQMQGVSRAWIELVVALQRLGRPAQEEQERWIQYLESSLDAAGNPPPLRTYHERRMAFIRGRQGRYAEGLAHARKALSLAERVYGRDSPHAANANIELGRVALTSGQYDEALAAGERALTYWKAAAGLEHPAALLAMDLLGAIQATTGRFAEGAATYEQLLAIYERHGITEGVNLIAALNSLAALYLEQGRQAEGARLLERSLVILDKMKGSDSIQRVIALNNLAELRHEQGRHAEALELARQAFTSAERSTAPENIIYTVVLTTLGEAELGVGETAKATTTLERAVGLMEKAPEHPKELGRARFILAKALYAVPSTRPRSLALLEQARGDLGKAGAVATRLRAACEAWTREQKLGGLTED